MRIDAEVQLTGYASTTASTTCPPDKPMPKDLKHLRFYGEGVAR